MRSTKVWLLSAFLLGAMGGSILLGTASFAQPGPGEVRREERSYWRHHNGRWSHWDTRDRRWYYTDGSHWYYNNGNRWDVYRFDKTFGRDNFERGGYVPPGPNATIVVPRHEVYVAPR